MIVIKETEHTKGDDWWKKEETRRDITLQRNIYLLKGNWKRFADCKQSKTQII